MFNPCVIVNHPVAINALATAFNGWMQFQASEKETKSRCSGGMRSNMPRASAQRPAGAQIWSWNFGPAIWKTTEIIPSTSQKLIRTSYCNFGILYHVHRFTLIFLDTVETGHLEHL